MRTATGLAPALADAYQALSPESAKGRLPSRDEVTVGLAKKSLMSMGETDLLGMAAQVAETVITRKYMAAAGSFSVYNKAEDVLYFVGHALRDIADALGHWDRPMNRDGTLRGSPSD